MPSRRRTSPSASPSGAGSRASTWLEPSTSATSPPKRRTACAISTPTGPPPMTSRRRGTAFIPVASRLVQIPSSSRSPGIGGMNGSAPFASTMCSAVWRTPSTSTTPVPASLPVPRSRSMPLIRQPALLTGVGVLGDHEVPPRERGLDVDLRGGRRVARLVDRLARAQQRLGRDARPIRALAADQLALDDGDPQPTLGERTGAVLAGGAGAQHDHVVVVAHGDLRSFPAPIATLVDPGGRDQGLTRARRGSKRETVHVHTPTPRRTP